MTTMPQDFPAPVEDPDSAPYWESLREEAMQLPYCTGCERFFFYPRTVCPHCHVGRVEWQRASGRGAIYSYTVVHRAPSPAFAADVPYTVALVDLDEDCRIVATVAADDAAHVRVGAPVRVDYHRVTDTVTLPMVRLVEEEVSA